MEAIILAGGLGTRLRQVLPDLPKAMAPIAGRPFLEILLSSLSKNGFTRVILSLGYKAEKIINHFGASFLGLELVYEVEAQPLGTGGAVRAALRHCSSDHAFIFNGDTYLEIEFNALELMWKENHNPIMVVRNVLDASRFGGLEIRNGRIHSFLEKGMTGAGIINAGCYVLPKQALSNFPLGQAFSLETDYFVNILQDQRVESFITLGKFIDIGIPEDYSLAQTELAGL